MSSAADRLAAAGYQRTRERDGCARCVHSEAVGSEDRKVYTCSRLNTQVNANGHCREFLRIGDAQQEIPFRQVVMRDLSATVGHAVAFQVARRWGGRELRVPVAVDEHHPLALSLGFDAAQRLVKAYGGQRLDLPLEANVLRQRRDAAIVRDRDRGASEEHCAITYGLTRQAVRAIVAKWRDRNAATTA